MPGSGSIAVVTDSTASLPARVVAERGIVVVPLQVVIGAQVVRRGARGGRHRDGATPAMVAEALKEFRPVSTSRPTPSALLEVYERAAAEGATEIVSIHLSGEMSGTFESAQLAAKDVDRAGARRRQPAGRRRHRVRRAVGRRRPRSAAGRRSRPWRRPAPAPRGRRRCSTSTPWSTCAAAAGSARPPRSSAARCRSSRCSRSPTARSPTSRRCAPPGKALNRLEALVARGGR